jgi:hypothetical protein
MKSENCKQFFVEKLFGVQGAGYALRGAGCELRVTRYAVRDTGCGLRIVRCGIASTC